uniref:Oligosaccharyltransferase complex subunit n=1 Tax=Cebus imitator TaxID=2715852 RepID=A0A2K5SE13_CEBIM
METLYGIPFIVLKCCTCPLPWLCMFWWWCLITRGIIYDVIIETPNVGSRPVAFLAYRVNGQYVMEGLAFSFLFAMGGLGFIILDQLNAPNIPKPNRFLLLFIGFVCVLLNFFVARVFMRMKLPGYLMECVFRRN